MTSAYDPSAHIQPLVVGPRDDSVLDQREITVQSYHSTVPFDRKRLESGFERAWLSPTIRFGLFARLPLREEVAATVVLGLQDELSIRTYDYDKRRPIWFSWQNVIVDTVSVHYFSDEHGLLQFTATGGGRRITPERLHDFNARFLGIPKASVTKRQFDLAKLRSLCFGRFIDRLYMLRFADPSGEDYRSIDHALFQSRKYIDPQAKRFQEIQNDSEAIIESFDSDVEVMTPALASVLQVRFFLKGLSGSLRLRIPKVQYKKEPRTPDEHARRFYELVDAAVSTILDTDYYTQESQVLDELSVDLGMFVDIVDLAPFQKAMANPESRAEFLCTADFCDSWEHWQPHLRAIDDLVQSDEIAAHCSDTIRDLANGAAQRLPSLLKVCREDAKLTRIGEIVASACCDALQRVPVEHRTLVEQELVAWALGQPDDVWRVDIAAGTIHVRKLAIRLEDLSLDTIVLVLDRLLAALHAALITTDGSLKPRLDQLQWCVEAIGALPPNHYRLTAPLRLIAERRVPRRPNESTRVLRAPVSSFADLDDALLDQFSLPAWPFLRANKSDAGLVISNHGLGAAQILSVGPAGTLFDGSESDDVLDLASGDEITRTLPARSGHITVRFVKFGAEQEVTLAVDNQPSVGHLRSTAPSPTVPISRKRLDAQRRYRELIDPTGRVIGSSPGMLEAFEQIHHANMIEGLAHVLILGERGVGKTHIAKLIHRASHRANGPFHSVNAGGAGGDLNIQRGEWIGFGKGHGVAGVDSKGRPGHLHHAQKGTLFVDEFATMSPELQVIFLSVLEQREVQRVGGDSFTPDVRCVFATNADIDAAVAAGTLRRDLVDRLAITIRIPPLRERRGDILLLARHYTAATRVDERCLIALLRHEWPGNIRELQKTISLGIARSESEGGNRLLLQHCNLPASLVEEAQSLEEDACSRELWQLADSIAKAEGFLPGEGLQKRAAEIMGVKEPQASKMYKEFGLNIDATLQSA